MSVYACALKPPPAFIGPKVGAFVSPTRAKSPPFVSLCVFACLPVCESLLNTLLFLISVFPFCLSVCPPCPPFPVQTVQIELAAYDASGILISSNLHLNNGRSWEAISLSSCLSFPLLEPPIPLSCPPLCLLLPCQCPPSPPSLIVYLGRWVSWEKGE